jgi:hypothetical protein
MVSGAGISEAPSSQAPFQTPTRPFHRSKDSIDTPGSELFPGDSASVINDDNLSDIGGRRRGPGTQASSIGAAQLPIVDDGTYLFKFVAPGGTNHRFQARYDSHEFLLDIISGKLASDPFFTSASSASTPAAAEGEEPVAAVVVPEPRDFQLSYRDDDGDLVLMTADHDIQDAVETAKKQGKDRVVLHVTGGASWKAAIAAQEAKAEEKTPAVSTTKKLVVVEETEEVEKEEGEESEEEEVKPAPKKRKGKTVAAKDEEELIGGVLPKDLLLPASIGFLGVVIAVVFIASRAGNSGR